MVRMPFDSSKEVSNVTWLLKIDEEKCTGGGGGKVRPPDVLGRERTVW